MGVGDGGDGSGGEGTTSGATFRSSRWGSLVIAVCALHDFPIFLIFSILHFEIRNATLGQTLYPAPTTTTTSRHYDSSHLLGGLKLLSSNTSCALYSMTKGLLDNAWKLSARKETP